MGFLAHFFYSLNAVLFMSSDKEARIAEWLLAQPGFEDFELTELRVRRHGQRSFVEVFLDRRQGLITLDECGRWNRILSDHLELSDLFADSFVVEVASPGLDRPLKRFRDFERALGRQLKVRYEDPAGTACEFIGRLERADETGVSLRSNEQELSLPYPRILQARQEVTF